MKSTRSRSAAMLAAGLLLFFLFIGNSLGAQAQSGSQPPAEPAPSATPAPTSTPAPGSQVSEQVSSSIANVDAYAFNVINGVPTNA